MLFSDRSVADLINDRFEPVWVSVRPVPIVRIDFGGGNVITRTLHGNIATYVLKPDGQIVDVLPGIYETSAYIDNLEQLWWLTRYSAGARNSSSFLKSYHVRQAELLAKGERSGRVIPMADMSKIAIEMNVERILDSRGLTQPVHFASGKSAEQSDQVSARPLKSWEKLVEDTRLNEQQRRLQIHQLLSSESAIKPNNVITRKIYREVLHADLDDPYLGLGDELFENYPFREDLPKAVKASR